MFPQPDKRIVVTNGKTAFQNTLSFTKNIDLSEDGYLKLSPPMCRILSSDQSGRSNVSLPCDIFRWSAGNFKVLGSGNNFSFAMSDVATNTTEESSTENQNGARVFPWVSNNWFINRSGAVYDYTGATVSSVYTSRISAALDLIELFVSRNTLVGVDNSGATTQNVLKQYDSTFSTSTNLTLPANFVITGAAYSNQTMGVITKQKKHEGNAYFFTWDGADTSATGAYPVNDPYILDIAAYKSSWVILTLSGQLLYFNGGGFDELGRLAGFDRLQTFVNLDTGSAIVYGKLIYVEGDKIYINMPSLPEAARDMKPYKPFAAGGAYCFDPKHGLYHTAAPSYSLYSSNSVTFASNVGTSSAHGLETGDELYDGSTTYYAIKLTENTFKVATSYDNAIDTTATTITDGSHSYFWANRTDYGQEALKLADLGLVKKHRDFTGFTSSGALAYFLGAKLHPNNLATTRVDALCVAVPVVHNRGYFVVGKFQTANLQESWQKVAIKYATLKNGDKIIVKAKTKDTKPVVCADQSLFSTAAYAGAGAIFDSSGAYFTTTTDLTGISEGDEVHVFAGPGAGQSAHITAISGSVSSGWEVTLDEPIRGTVSGRTSCVSIDKFKKCGVITKDDTDGVKTLNLGNPGTALEVKVELRGIDVKVSEVLPIKAPHQLAV